jgi:hypothetical protein
MMWDDMSIISKWRAMDFYSVRKERFEWERRENITGTEAEHSDGPKKLQIGNFKAVFFFLVLGIGVGSCAFGVEIFESKYRQYKKLSNEKHTSIIIRSKGQKWDLK